MKNKKIKILLNFLNADECLKIINNTYDKNVLVDRILVEIKKYFITDIKGFNIDIPKELVLKKYSVDQKYSDFKAVGENYLSFLIQLNDDYSDGHFQFLLDGGDSYFQVHHGMGHLVLFFSNLDKRTTPVTSGIKYTLTGDISLIKLNNSDKTLI